MSALEQIKNLVTGGFNWLADGAPTEEESRANFAEESKINFSYEGVTSIIIETTSNNLASINSKVLAEQGISLDFNSNDDIATFAKQVIAYHDNETGVEPHSNPDYASSHLEFRENTLTKMITDALLEKQAARWGKIREATYEYR